MNQVGIDVDADDDDGIDVDPDIAVDINANNQKDAHNQTTRNLKKTLEGMKRSVNHAIDLVGSDESDGGDRS